MQRANAVLKKSSPFTLRNAHARNDRISISALKSDDTIVFLDLDFH